MSVTFVGPVLVGHNKAVCLRCAGSVEGDDVTAWADWHARQDCWNYTGYEAATSANVKREPTRVWIEELA